MFSKIISIQPNEDERKRYDITYHYESFLGKPQQYKLRLLTKTPIMLEDAKKIADKALSNEANRKAAKEQQISCRVQGYKGVTVLITTSTFNTKAKKEKPKAEIETPIEGQTNTDENL